jgi:hypothetical protein
MSEKSLAFIGNASAHEGRGEDARSEREAFSIRRLEGSGWRLERRRQLWGLKAALVLASPACPAPTLSIKPGVVC